MKEFKVERPKVDKQQPHLDIGGKLTDQKIVDMLNFGHQTPVAPSVGDIYFRRMSEDPTNGDVYTYLTKVDNKGNAIVMGQRWVAATGQYEEVRQGGYDQKYSVDALKQGKIDLTEHKIIDNTTGVAWRTQITEWGVSGVTPTRGNSSGPDAASALAQEFAAKQKVAYVYDKDGRIIDGPGVNNSEVKKEEPKKGSPPPVDIAAERKALRGAYKNREESYGRIKASIANISAYNEVSKNNWQKKYNTVVFESDASDWQQKFDSLEAEIAAREPKGAEPAQKPPRVPDNTPTTSTVPPLRESLKGIAIGLKAQGIKLANPESLEIQLGQRDDYSEAGKAGVVLRNRLRASRLGRAMRFKTPEEKAAERAALAAAARPVTPVETVFDASVADVPAPAEQEAGPTVAATEVPTEGIIEVPGINGSVSHKDTKTGKFVKKDGTFTSKLEKQKAHEADSNGRPKIEFITRNGSLRVAVDVDKLEKGQKRRILRAIGDGEGTEEEIEERVEKRTGIRVMVLEPAEEDHSVAA